jgi:hypothetical protein
MMNTFTTTVDQVLKGKDTAADTSDTGGGAGDERGAHGR